MTHLRFIMRSARAVLAAYGQTLADLAPRLLSLAFGGLIVLELVRLGFILTQAPPSVPAPPLQGLRPKAPIIAIEKILAAHLFGIAPTRNDDDLDRIPNSKENLLLAGTIAGEDPARGMAIIVEEAASALYSVGDDVHGAQLQSVYPDRVILDRSGALETLSLPNAMAARKTIAKSGNFSAPVLVAERFKDSAGRVVEDPPALIYRVFRSVPLTDDNGHMRGIMVYPGNNAEPFAKLGLAPGDLVTAVNGAELSDASNAAKVLASLDPAGRATMTVQRGNRSISVLVDVGGAVAELPN